MGNETLYRSQAASVVIQCLPTGGGAWAPEIVNTKINPTKKYYHSEKRLPDLPKRLKLLIENGGGIQSVRVPSTLESTSTACEYMENLKGAHYRSYFMLHPANRAHYKQH